MVLVAALIMMFFILLGVPISFSIGFGSILGILIAGSGAMPMYVVVQKMTGDLNTFTLLAIPMFMLAGNIMAKADISRRILEFCNTALSWLRGGMGIVCVLANTIFAGITGSGYASITSIGLLTLPGFKSKGYGKGFYSGVIAGAGALGPIIPPSSTMIVYSLATGVSVGRMFIGGIGPGLLIALGLMAMCYLYARKHNIDYGGAKFDIRDTWRDFKKAFFALLMPVIMLGGVMSGIFTATEAGVVSCIYGMICGIFIYKTMTFKDMKEICIKSAQSAGMIMLVLACTGILTYMFARSGTVQDVSQFLMSIPGGDNKWVLFTVLMVFFLLVGIPLEVTPILRIMMPLIYPALLAAGVDELMFGVLACISAVIGNLSPPIGNYMFLSMKVCNVSYKEISRYMWMVTGIFVGVLLFCGYLAPGVITWLPDVFMGRK